MVTKGRPLEDSSGQLEDLLQEVVKLGHGHRPVRVRDLREYIFIEGKEESVSVKKVKMEEGNAEKKKGG